jgi:hypothetical protein
MKIRTYKDNSGEIGIVLIPEFCAEEEQLMTDLLNNKFKIIEAKSNPFIRGIALVMKEGKFSPFSAIENSKGNRFHLNPFRRQNED